MTPSGAQIELASGDQRVVVVEVGGVLRSSTAGTGFDFRQPRAIGQLRLDHCYAGLERGADGRATAELRDVGSGVQRRLWVDETFGYLMVFSGDTLGDAARRSVAIEPMTCPPNALRSGEGVIRLEPGASWSGSWGITPG